MNKKTWKEYFAFTKKERISLVIITILIAAVWFWPKPTLHHEPIQTAATDTAAVITKNEERKTHSNFVYRKYDTTRKQYQHYKPKYTTVDINSADTAAFIALPGIGSKLALRIVTFRDKLGGFYSIDQLSETYGLSDSVFQKIKQYLRFQSNSFKKININTATLDELKQHPYIRYNLARLIVAYRTEHGSFSSAGDLQKMSFMTDSIYHKLKPYLE